MASPLQGLSPPLVPSGVGGVGSGSSGSNSSGQISDTLGTTSAGSGNLIIIAAGNPQIPKPGLFAFMQAVSQASMTNKNITYDSSSALSLVTAEFYRNMLLDAQRLISLQNVIAALIQAQEPLIDNINQDIDNENAQITAYDTLLPNDTSQSTNLNVAANDLNEAQILFQQQTEAHDAGFMSDSDYQNAQQTYTLILGTYNGAVSSYNVYVTSRNNSITTFNDSVINYNAKVTANNLQITAINVQRVAAGLSPMALQTPLPYVISFLPTATSAPPIPVEVLPILIPPVVNGIGRYPTPIDDFQSPFLPQTIVIQTLATLQGIYKFQAYVDYFLHTKTAVYALPGAFTSQLAASNTTVSGTNLNAGLAAISSSLDPVIVQRLFNQGAQNAYYQSFTSVLKPGTIDATLVATSNVLASASFVNAQQLVDSLQKSLKGVNEDENLINNALALGFVKNTLEIVSKNALPEALAGFVSPSEKNNPAFESTSNALNSTVALSLLGSSLALLSSTVDVPGLGAQLLRMSGLNEAEVFNLTSQGIGLNNFVSNPFTQSLFVQKLSDQIAQAIGQSNNAELLGAIQNAVLEAAQKTSALAQPDQFLINLTQNVNNNPLTGTLAPDILVAARSAFLGPAFDSRIGFRNDLQQSLITQGFNTNEALQISSSIASVPSSATTDALFNTNNINTQLLIANLAYNLLLAGIKTPSDIATQVITKLLANTREVAEANLRDNLKRDLVVQGLTQEEAARVAAGIDIPLITQNTVQSISQAEIHLKLTESISNIYSPLLTNEQTRAHAQLLADSLVGPVNAIGEDNAHPFSLVNSLRNHLNVLKDLKDQVFFNTSMENFKDYLKPSTDLFSFSQQFLDPGKRYVYASLVMFPQPATTGPVKMGGTVPPLEGAV